MQHLEKTCKYKLCSYCRTTLSTWCTFHQILEKSLHSLWDRFTLKILWVWLIVIGCFCSQEESVFCNFGGYEWVGPLSLITLVCCGFKVVCLLSRWFFLAVAWTSRIGVEFITPPPPHINIMMHLSSQMKDKSQACPVNLFCLKVFEFCVSDLWSCLSLWACLFLKLLCCYISGPLLSMGWGSHFSSD